MTFTCWIVSTRPEGLLTAIVAAAIGVATWRIAWEQKEIAKEKIISDLFDKRFKIYQAHIQAVVEIVMRGEKGAGCDVLKSDMIYFGEQAQFIYD